MPTPLHECLHKWLEASIVEALIAGTLLPVDSRSFEVTSNENEFFYYFDYSFTNNKYLF